MSKITPPTAAPYLAELFRDSFDEDTAAAFELRIQQFLSLMAQGGSRQDFSRWNASVLALRAALDIISTEPGRASSTYSPRLNQGIQT